MEKQIEDKYYLEIKKRVLEGQDITNSVREVMGEEFTDSKRRFYSKKLHKDGVVISESTAPEKTNEYKEALNRELPFSKRYLLTCAQADTKLHKRFWNNMQAYAKYLGAQIIVQPSRYKSPTSLEASNRVKRNEKNKSMWASELRPYLYAKDLDLNSSVTFLGGLKIQPTATNPLSGLNVFTDIKSSIVPHPKLHLESCHTLPNYPAKIMMTTGAVTVPNYTDTKAGKRGEVEHAFGFAIVELENDLTFHARQVEADKNGSFYDLWNKVDKGEVTQFKGVPAIVFGDSHFGQHCEKSHKLAIDIANTLEAENIVLNDILDADTINHHKLLNPVERLKDLSNRKFSNISEEIDYVLYRVQNIWGAGKFKVNVLQSNHDLFIEKWLAMENPKTTKDLEEYVYFMNLLRSNEEARKGILHYYLTEVFPKEKVQSYTVNDSLRIKGIELGMHGHLGGNGARGSLTGFRNLSIKTVTAHQHAPARRGNTVIVGTLSKKYMGYNKGASNWMNGIVIIYPNGKVQNINFIQNKFTTMTKP